VKARWCTIPVRNWRCGQPLPTTATVGRITKSKLRPRKRNETGLCIHVIVSRKATRPRALVGEFVGAVSPNRLQHRRNRRGANMVVRSFRKAKKKDTLTVFKYIRSASPSWLGLSCIKLQGAASLPDLKASLQVDDDATRSCQNSGGPRRTCNHAHRRLECALAVEGMLYSSLRLPARKLLCVVELLKNGRPGTAETS
jgi:hypothetical protein